MEESYQDWNVLRGLIVQIESEKSEELTYGSLKLFTPEKVTKHNEFGHRNAFGTVVGCPDFNDVNIGDTIWFHHNIVINQTNMMSMADNKRTVSHQYRIDAENKLYKVPYSEKDFSMNCMAYLKKDAETGEKEALNFFVMGKGVKKDDFEERFGIIIKNQHEKGLVLEAEIKYSSKQARLRGALEGDIVGLVENSNYDMDVEGEKLWRFPVTSIVYHIRDGVFIPALNYVFVTIKDNGSDESTFFIKKEEAQREAKVVAVGKDCKYVSRWDDVILEGKRIFELYIDADGEQVYVVHEDLIDAVVGT